MGAKEGYQRARELLDEKCGHKHTLAMAYVEKLAQVNPIKDEDAEALESYSILLTSCKNSLEANWLLAKA